VKKTTLILHCTLLFCACAVPQGQEKFVNDSGVLLDSGQRESSSPKFVREVFQQVYLPKIDFLVVFDHSPALASSLSLVGSRLKAYMSHFLRQSPPDYQFARLDAGSVRGLLHEPDAVVTGHTSTVEARIHRKLSFQAVSGSKSATIFQSIAASFSPSAFKVSKANRLFFRKDALLWLFIVSARDDHSSLSVGEFLQTLRVLKKRTKYPNVFVSLYSGGKQGCVSTEIKAASAPKLTLFSSHFMQESYSLCQNISFLRELRDRPPVGFYRHFFLTKKPITNTLRVSINQVTLLRKGSTGKTQWKYEKRSNKIELFTLTRPGDTITVSFLEQTSL
jgi:hypothetical protein